MPSFLLLLLSQHLVGPVNPIIKTQNASKQNIVRMSKMASGQTSAKHTTANVVNTIWDAV